MEAFRAQQQAADALHARLVETAALLEQISCQASALAWNTEFRNVLRNEYDWLHEAERFVVEVRRLREEERRYHGFHAWRQWVLAVLFALAAAAAAGAGYGWSDRVLDGRWGF